MESLRATPLSIRPILSDTFSVPFLPILSSVLFIALTAFFIWPESSGPPSLWERIPRVSNTLQYMTDHKTFMHRIMDALKNTDVARFYLGRKQVYLVTGAHNVQSIFRPSTSIGNEELMLSIVLPRIYRLPPHEVERFAQDKTGRGKVPAKGTVETPLDERHWHSYDHIHNEYLSRPRHLNRLSGTYFKLFSERFDTLPLGKWSTVSIVDICRREVAKSAMTALVGPRVFEMYPNFIDTFWEFDSVIFSLSWGFPRWLWKSYPHQVQDRYYDMIKHYMDAAWENFDWNGPDADADWEPLFGARICREIVRWLKGSKFCDSTAAGFLSTLLFAQNSNSIPISMWVMMEVIQDPELFREVREEVLTTYITDPKTGKETIDTQKLLGLPLLQSIFNETLRLHMSFNPMRQVKEPITIDKYKIKPGTMLQLPMQVAHWNEGIWSVPGHPAKEFWPERHIKYADEVDESGKTIHKRVFNMEGLSGSFFPFGGGASMCPGRHFAKHEILMTVALLVTKFDIEFDSWTNLSDGSPSDRPALNNEMYAGAVAMPPDRDMKVRWRRIR